jgi:hypothetical protein
MLISARSRPSDEAKDCTVNFQRRYRFLEFATAKFVSIETDKDQVAVLARRIQIEVARWSIS